MGVLGLLGCKDGGEPPPDQGEVTPLDIALRKVQPPQVVRTRGKVAAVTYGNDPEDPLNPIPPHRYVIFELPEEELRKLPPDVANSLPPFAVGFHLPKATLDTRTVRLPQRGDLVEVTGRLTTIDFRLDTLRVPVIDELTSYRILSSDAPMLADLGQACQHDMDCQDDLICERNHLCQKPPTIKWGADFRNIDGTCVSDSDCPLGQVCDPRYTVNTTSGDYRIHYFPARNVGRHICQVDRASPAQAHCPRSVTPEELLGGRFAAGKEVCVRSRIAFAVFVPGDRDTHVQGIVAQSEWFPDGNPTLDTFGHALENSPAYKDPANPLGPIVDPQANDEVELLGTVHYDESHFWWELHPIKWYRKLPAGP